MADKLIIVESPAKANTIKKFLGGSTKVVASMGHIRDLPKSKLGVDIEHDFEPEYINIRGKGDLIKSLKADSKKAKKVYLATDPDREGEAIAWHLSKILEDNKEKITRVTFNEITKTAVQKAIKEPRNIDMNTVDAQQARRVLDRIVGYKISPLLWKKVKRGLSAGRVQSVAVKLIVDRENEIENFISEEYWNIYANLKDEKSKKQFEAKFYGKNGKKEEITSKEQADTILKNIKNAKYINCLGKSSVVEFIEIIRRAKFVITNDTGAYHIALSLEVPVSIITGGYTYDGFVAYNFKNNKYKKPYIVTNQRECFNCNSNCKYLEDGQEKWPCLHAVTVDYAWNIVEKMIDDIQDKQ